MTTTPRVVRSGLGFPEAPRWHEGRLWFSDFLTRTVNSLGSDGSLQREAYVPGQPSGLGFLPDGELLVVSSFDRKLLRLRRGQRAVAADLFHLANSALNELHVVPDGRAYVTTFGLDTLHRPHHEVGNGQIIMVEPDGTARVVADGLAVPNGMASTADGGTLIVAETRACRLTAFDVSREGSLNRRRTFVDCAGRQPDGICLDRTGAVWVAWPFTAQLARFAPDGMITAQFDTPDRWVTSCVLGGGELYCTTARTTRAEFGRGESHGAVEAFPVAPSGSS